MRLRFLFSWIIVFFVTFNILFVRCIAENSRSGGHDAANTHGRSVDGISRSKRTLKFNDIPLSIKKRLAENLQTIADYEDDNEEDKNEEYFDVDYGDKNIRKRDVKQSDIKIEKNNREERDPSGKQADLELTKSEQKEVEKKVENEILTLKKRSKTRETLSKKSSPRYIKIQLDTVNIGNSNDEAHREKHQVKHQAKNTGQKKPKNHTKTAKNQVEDVIEKKIDNIKDKLRREVEKDLKITVHKEKRSNAVPNQLANNDTSELYLNNTSSPGCKIILKRSVLHRDTADIKKGRINQNLVKKDGKLAPHAGINKNKVTGRRYRNSKLPSTSQNSQGKTTKLTHKPKKQDKTHEKLKERVKASKKHSAAGKSAMKGRKQDKKSDQRGPKGFNFLFPSKLPSKVTSHRANTIRESGKKVKKAYHHVQFKIHGKKHVARSERDVDEVKSSVAVEANQLDDPTGAQDPNQMAVEYRETFGAHFNDPGSSSSRYKRVKRFQTIKK